jgi:NAD(P)-dependent dehydrogenase (short-subunit alcohol dehydrogenase family)
MATLRLDGAVVAVVGAGGVLGAAISRHLAGRGASVVLAGRTAEPLDATAASDPRLADAPRVVCDVRDPAAGDALVAAALAAHSRLDGLVLAHGVVAFGDLLDTDDETIEELFLTNVVGPLWLLRRVVPVLGAPPAGGDGKGSGGFVANLSAVVAEQPLAGMTSYSASKAALTAADVALARELRRRGITVCDVRPPHTETGLATRPLAGTAPRLPEGLDPEVVAARVVAAIEAGEREVPAANFGS